MKYFKKFASFASLLFISVFLSIVSPQFLTLDNILSVGLQISVIALLSIGELLVIITAGIDLSVGSILAFSGVITSLLLVNELPIPFAILIGIAAGTFCGCINGIIITKGKLPPFIATLGMMGIARGLSLIITNGIPLFGLPYNFSYIANSKLFDVIPIPVIIVIIAAIIIDFILKNFSFGRYIYALGGNFEATRLAGVKVDKELIKVYAISGFFAGLGGVILASRLSTGQPTAATGYELDVIAACVIGGASLSGGSGTIIGAMIGALIIGILRNGCNLLNISAFWQQVAIGSIIIIAVFMDQYKKKFSKD